MGIRTALLCLLVVSTGCTMPLGAPGTPTTTDSETATETEPKRSTATPGRFSGSCFDVQPVYPIPSLTVELRLDQARITISDLRNGSVVWNDTYRGPDVVEFSPVTAAFQRGGLYQVVIRANGSVRWNHTVGTTSEMKIRVTETDVIVERHAIVDPPTPCPDTGDRSSVGSQVPQ